MLTRDQLMELDRALADEWVLSVYLKDAATDPAERTAWRRRLDVAVAELRRSLEDLPHAEREAFDEAVVRLEERLAGFRGFLPDASWVGFVTKDGVRHAESLHVALPPLVTWQRGARLAPYLNGASATDSATVVVADSRMARIHRATPSGLELLDTVHAHAELQGQAHMGYPPRQGFHTGTRGETGADVMERELRTGRERMLREVGERVTARALPDEPVLVAGIPEVAIEAIATLPAGARARAERLPRLEVHASDAMIASAANEYLATRRQDREMAAVVEVLSRAAEAGRGVTTLAPTREALRGGAVDRLCVTERFVVDQVAEAEEAVRTALRAGAEVLVVRGAAAERLDRDAGGIAARLRYVPWTSTARAETAGTRG